MEYNAVNWLQGQLVNRSLQGVPMFVFCSICIVIYFNLYLETIEWKGSYGPLNLDLCHHREKIPLINFHLIVRVLAILLFQNSEVFLMFSLNSFLASLLPFVLVPVLPLSLNDYFLSSFSLSCEISYQNYILLTKLLSIISSS